jgi:ribosome recycling factor
MASRRGDIKIDYRFDMDDFATKLQTAVTWLNNEYASIRTGQATPALLDSVKVESYGSFMPINQVASVGAEDARTLRVSPWDAGLVKTIETAIRDADLGVSVVADSSGLRVIFPELSGDRRIQMLKIGKGKLEDARVSVRAMRDDAMKALEKLEKEGGMGEDDKFAKRDIIQKHVEAVNRELDGLYAKKEIEINR